MTLAVILQNPAPEVPLSGSSTDEMTDPEGTHPIGWDNEQAIDTSKPNRGSILSRGTLVVCPVSLVGQWIAEAMSKLKQPGLVYAYHGNGRTRNPLILANQSIVVTTYAVLASDSSYHVKQASKRGETKYIPPCEQIRWWRIILDESHSIRTPGTYQSEAVMSLVGDHKWAITGTPINTSLDDLKQQLRFVGLPDVDTLFSLFSETVLKNGYPRPGKRNNGHFVFFMRNVMFRHSLDQKYLGTETTLMNLPGKVSGLKDGSFMVCSTC